MANNRNADNRPKRTPVAERNKISFDHKEPGYVYRLVNDVEGRLDTFKEAGYEVVTGDAALGDNEAGAGSRLGSAITKHVGNGTKGVLMRIKQEWYDEDQKKKLDDLRKAEAALKYKTKNAGEGFYGGNLEINS